jgi:hypothetical protein
VPELDRNGWSAAVADDVADDLPCAALLWICQAPLLSCATLPSRLGLSGCLSTRNRKVEARIYWALAP